MGGSARGDLSPSGPVLRIGFRVYGQVDGKQSGYLFVQLACLAPMGPKRGTLLYGSLGADSGATVELLGEARLQPETLQTGCQANS